MANKQVIKQQNKRRPQVEANIKEINKIRKELGKPALPIRNNKWYDVVESYASRYGNMEIAIKMIGADMSVYKANKWNNQNANTAKADINRMVNSQHGRFTLDEAIRSNSLIEFESNQFSQFNATQETLLESGNLNVSDVGTLIRETEIKVVRKK